MTSTLRSRTIADLGELGVIELFKRLWQPRRPILQKYDDAWAFKTGRAYVTVSTDMLVERTDVPPGMTYELAARKAVVMSSSDIVSKGHAPTYHLASIGVRPDTASRRIREIVAGIRRGLSECGGELIGGDTNEALELTLSMTTLGVRETRPVPRILGREGDIVATTGAFGGPPSGLLILLGRAARPRRGLKGMIDAALRPKAHVRAGVSLAGAAVLSGSTDSSDGLSASLHNMIANCDRGAVLQQVPYVHYLEEFAADNGLDPLDLAMNGGEEYNLVLSIKRDQWKKALRVADSENFELHKLGRVVRTKGLWMLDREGNKHAIPRGGWSHFERKTKKGTRWAPGHVIY